MEAMNTTQGWFRMIRWKLIASVAAAAALFVTSGALGFPRIFQLMFIGYAVLGFVVFVLLDAPPMKPLTGVAAGMGIAIFYIALSVIFTLGGNLLPQFDPQKEIAGIGRKTAKFKQDPAVTESLLVKSRELSAKADEIMAKLEQLQASGGGLDVASLDVDGPTEELKKPAPRDTSGMDPVERGKLVYQDHECYNCHKVGGKGGKKRGPELDNIGNLATAEQLKEKIFEPTAWYADGYKERKKDKMPDKYKEVMSDEELDSLVAYLMTLRNTSVKTPKPIFEKK
jgi:mono/diheme cytochrome c family protein